MIKYTTFIAMSKDGYIADKNGTVSFLENLNIIGDGGYQKYYNDIDALVFGSSTYKYIMNVQQWPYQGKTSYVLTHTPNKFGPKSDVVFTSMSILELDEKIQNKHNHIWVMGGANVINQYLNKNKIETMIISVVNVELHDGIKLFPNKKVLNNFKIIKRENFGDIENITYHTIL